jgi:ABC-2 type transport system permease protein
MNQAIWRKAIRDAWVQLAVTAGLLALFGWLFVWLMSLFDLGLWASFVNLLPDFVNQLIGVSPADLVTVTGRVSFLYVHVVTLLMFISWAVGRGSDTVSGGIASGHLELIVTLPVWRISVIVAPAVVATVGSALLALSLWLGNWVGLATVTLEGEASIAAFLPGAVNLFAMAFCLAGVTTLLSSFDRDRWRTIWLAGAFFVVSSIVKLVARLWEAGAWLRYLSFLTAFEPQQIILLRDEAWSASLEYNLPLLIGGVLAYAAAVVVFCRRDIPVPR